MIDGLSSLNRSDAVARGRVPVPVPRQGADPSAQNPPSASQPSQEYSRTSLSGSQVKALAEEINSTLQQMDGQFSVSVDDATGMVIVRITDSDTGEVVKQIPPQQILDANVSVERIVGLLVDDQA